jgi:hypothetical protein
MMTARHDDPCTLATIRPGPTLHLWRDGVEVAAVTLTPHAALALAESLLREVRAALARDGKAAEPR